MIRPDLDRLNPNLNEKALSAETLATVRRLVTVLLRGVLVADAYARAGQRLAEVGEDPLDMTFAFVEPDMYLEVWRGFLQDFETGLKTLLADARAEPAARAALTEFRDAFRSAVPAEPASSLNKRSMMAVFANQMELGLQDRAIRKLEAVTYLLVDGLPRAPLEELAGEDGAPADQGPESYNTMPGS
ncbi:hypothetical protein [Brevundimonas goettingensis]|uniref:Uncharacterized protein n=1 Tax=Brevundimonas goettingensis TaxID=2774190 RepID=A0A975C3K8_9CAUL|nr:hypothetical protein [Brevundimonas goettingensis]QTC92855.1 hypothetical protein IFJ75_08435 [Brevundimonas goettingensis]